jgi:hypothetical protein
MELQIFEHLSKMKVKEGLVERRKFYPLGGEVYGRSQRDN